MSVSARPRSPRGTSGGARGSASSFRVFRCSSSRQEKGSHAAVRVTGRGDKTHREPLRRHVRTRESAHRRRKSHFRRGRARECAEIGALTRMNGEHPKTRSRRSVELLGDRATTVIMRFSGKKVPYEYPVGKKHFLAGIRTPEGRVKADNDNHYITRNSFLPFGRSLFSRC